MSPFRVGVGNADPYPVGHRTNGDAASDAGTPGSFARCSRVSRRLAHLDCAQFKVHTLPLTSIDAPAHGWRNKGHRLGRLEAELPTHIACGPKPCGATRVARSRPERQASPGDRCGLRGPRCRGRGTDRQPTPYLVVWTADPAEVEAVSSRIGRASAMQAASPVDVVSGWCGFCAHTSHARAILDSRSSAGGPWREG